MTSVELSEFEKALTAFQDAAARLDRAWQDVPADVLGDSYALPESFDYYCATVQGWTIQP